MGRLGQCYSQCSSPRGSGNVLFNEKPIKARNPDGDIPRETAWFCIHTRANALPTRAETRKGH